ncbi:SPOR domain-containing protein [Bacillus sp. BRMEA1]|uniref:SPOR domain-containing protein n=1 Tax=Neobacillus endophyticus TaxID=2738405 RepID=UPI0015670A81|nr:SPOR domain-containing protein [Neobacillus endophyticus]NRD75996.1 SPOR domain-containing protein [Neobacillus endophyticus]
MDNPKKGGTIKIRINGDQKTFQENLQSSEPQADQKPNLRVIKISPDPPSSDVVSETAAAQESADESFDWVIPESSNDEFEPYMVNKNPLSKKGGQKNIASFTPFAKKKNGRAIGPVFVSAFFAILVGTAIGIFMLKLVINEPGKKTQTVPAVTEESGKTNGTADSGKSVSASIEQMTTYIVQGGIYSSQDGAKDTVNQLNAKQIPAKIIDMNGKTYIFLGVADSIETAKSLCDQYKQNGAEDAFAKPLLVDGKKLSGITSTEKTFIETMPAIYKSLSNAASAALTANALPEDSLKAITALQKQLTSKDVKNSKVKKMQDELISANENIMSFQKSKDSKSLNDAEQHLLNYLSYYFSL